ncbi:MAG: Fis family transcriptional regulator [Deltaproteobacteria bacterium RIFOXYD12_FULL_50_9]|nr:MAG: Fis family transcriptional regulator [Deltaproteobacteria bacterium RIFOXYD12_FULL_50_9]
MAQKILIVDDEKSIQESLAGILGDEGFEPTCSDSAEEGLARIEEEKIDLVLMDIWMPGMDGIDALKRIKETHPHLPVIMISGHGTIETAVQATRNGAFDFIEKPLSYDKIILAVNNALYLSSLEKENLILRQRSAPKAVLIGNSAIIERLRVQIERVAPTDAWVLIRGEHGTGKEVVAQTIHRLSSTSSKPMIEINCAAIPEELIESELFGHEKGSFTGAVTAKRGKFDLADGGMLFLDEIGDMSLKTQAKILRILQEQKFERVGGAKTISVNVRVLAATNKNLEGEIERGTFRADLFWRLNVVPIVVPPLRERLQDIPQLVESFMEEFSRKGMGEKRFAPEAIQAMQHHSWPGNVRELRNFIERLAIMTPEPFITGELIATLLQVVPGSSSPANPADSGSRYLRYNFKDARREFERDYLQARLNENNGNISATAERIGLERSHLYKKMKTLEIVD